MANLTRESSIAWKRRVTEGVVIVGSILLAFAIDAWWEGRAERAVEEDILRAAAAEVDANRAALRGDLQVHDDRLDRIDRFLRASPGELSELPEDSLFDMTRSFANAPSFNPRLEAISVLAQATARTPRGREAHDRAGAIWFSTPAMSR